MQPVKKAPEIVQPNRSDRKQRNALYAAGLVTALLSLAIMPAPGSALMTPTHVDTGLIAVRDGRPLIEDLLVPSAICDPSGLEIEVDWLTYDSRFVTAGLKKATYTLEAYRATPSGNPIALMGSDTETDSYSMTPHSRTSSTPLRVSIPVSSLAGVDSILVGLIAVFEEGISMPQFVAPSAYQSTLLDVDCDESPIETIQQRLWVPCAPLSTPAWTPGITYRFFMEPAGCRDVLPDDLFSHDFVHFGAGASGGTCQAAEYEAWYVEAGEDYRYHGATASFTWYPIVPGDYKVDWVAVGTWYINGNYGASVPEEETHGPMTEIGLAPMRDSFFPDLRVVQDSGGPQNTVSIIVHFTATIYHVLTPKVGTTLECATTITEP